MDFFGRSTNVDGAPSERIVSRDIEQCPFLRNIGEPTSSCFSVLKFPLSVKGEKGPIFEEGPSFDTALRLFHGRDGVVPLSGRSSVSKLSKPEDEMGASSSQFHPLAAPAATISLSAFDPGGPFSFNYFMGKQKVPKQIKKEGDSRNKPNSSSSQNGHNHQGMGNEWLETGNCPIAKSYQAVSRVLPLVATVFQLPPGMKVRCPPAIVAARAALARTALAKSLRPKPVPSKMFTIGLLGMAANVPLGVWREHTEIFSILVCCHSCCNSFCCNAKESSEHTQVSDGVHDCCCRFGPSDRLKGRKDEDSIWAENAQHSAAAGFTVQKC